MKKILFFFASFLSCWVSFAEPKTYCFLLGTYTNTGLSEGVYSYSFKEANGNFKKLSVNKGIENPSYLAFSPDKKFVYTVNECGDSSTVSAFVFSNLNGSLEFLNKVPSCGADPCYITVTDKHVIVANYNGGSIAVFVRKADGSLSEAVQLIKHVGGSIDPSRQLSSHVHETVFQPGTSTLFVCDLGKDKVFSYHYDAEGGRNPLRLVDSLNVKPGSGPRHMAFSKEGRYAYVLHELDGTLSVLAVNGGKMKLMGETTVDRKKNISNGAAEIAISPDGKFLYASNRGTANDISVFKVERAGSLKFIQQIPSGGNGPRNFVLTPDGKYILAANQNSNNIVAFLRDKETGSLKKLEGGTLIGAPVCIVFY